MIEGLPAGVTTPTTVILALLLSSAGVNIWALRALFTRRLVPDTHHAEVLARYEAAIEDRDERIKDISSERDQWRTVAQSLSEQNADLLTNQDLTLAAWNSIKAYVSVKEAGET